MTTELQTKTLVLAAVFYFLTGFGITGGYHRLWSHKGWNAIAPVRFVVLMFGAAALQGSARWWCRNHRAHHKFTDTTKVWPARPSPNNGSLHTGSFPPTRSRAHAALRCHRTPTMCAPGSCMRTLAG